jgi:hypothetical protein
MTKIQIELPEATAKAARDAGLLTPQALDRLLTDAIKRQADAGVPNVPALREWTRFSLGFAVSSYRDGTGCIGCTAAGN